MNWQLFVIYHDDFALINQKTYIQKTSILVRITKPNSKIMKAILLALFIGVLSFTSYGQESSEKTTDGSPTHNQSTGTSGNYQLFVGADFGYMVSTYNHSPNISVEVDYLSSAHVQLNGIIEMPSKGIIKTGLSTYYLKSGLVNGENHYNSYCAIPIVATFKRFELQNNRALHLMAGPQISFLTEYGNALTGDDFYNLTPGGLNTFKAGFTTDICFLSRNGNWIRSIGIKTIVDIPAATSTPNSQVVMLDNYGSNVFYFGITRVWKGN